MPTWLATVLPYIVPALIAAGGLWWINRRKPMLDSAQAAALRSSITAGNGVERAELSRVVSEAAAEMIQAQRIQAQTFAAEAVSTSREMAVLRANSVSLEKQLKDQRVRFEGELALERSRLGGELDVERKERMALALELAAAKTRITVLEQKVSELETEKSALHARLKLVPPVKPGS